MKFDTIEVDGRTIEYICRDGGEVPIVCVGGLLADPVIEACFFSRFPANYRIINMVLRGHGKVRHELPFSPELCAQDLLSLVKALDIANPVFFAMSFGGLVASLAAARLPSLRGLVFAGTAPFPDNADTRAFIQSVRDGTETFEIHVPSVQPYLFHRRDLEENIFVRTCQEYYKVHFPKDLFADIVLSYLRDFPIPIDQIRCPVGAMINLRDRLVSPALQIEFARSLKAKAYVLPHSGHIGHGENPDEIIANVISFEMNECTPLP